MNTLYISDLDGTLLNPQAQLSKESFQILQKLTASGTHFTCATARTATTTKQILHGLHLSAPAILMNGVAILDWNTKEYVKVEYLNSVFYHNLMQKFHEFHLNSFVYSIDQNELYCSHLASINNAMQQFRQERIDRFQKKFTCVESLEEINTSTIAYILLLEQKETLQPLCDWLNSNRSQFGIDFCFYPEIYLKDTWCLEIFNSRASKYNAVQFLKNTYQYDYIVGFGDNLNDLSLFQACDETYAVANAKSEVKAAATAIIGPNTEDSVPRHIQSLELEKY